MPAPWSEPRRVGTTREQAPAQLLELEASAVPASLDLVQDLVAEIWVRADQIGAPDRMRFEGALVEVVANVIEHARPSTPDGTVSLRVTLSWTGLDLLAVIVDDGGEAELDIEAASMPSSDYENGRGLAMARALSDELRYERDIGSNRWIVRCRYAR
jgi:serine/threonine-protein kinase RsbW